MLASPTLANPFAEWFALLLSTCCHISPKSNHSQGPVVPYFKWPHAKEECQGLVRSGKSFADAHIEQNNQLIVGQNKKMKKG